MALKRLVVSCGGTGGHFNPGLSIARELKAQGGEPVMLLGGKHSETQAQTAEKFGIKSVRIESAQIPKNPIAAIKFALATLSGTRKSLALLKSFKPEALLVMGSFASLPPAIAAKIAGVPMFLHDGNAKLGKANKILSRWAKALALSFPATNATECHCPAILTGMPLRQELCSAQTDKPTAIDFINTTFKSSFDANEPLILVFGGSLGAETINKSSPEALKALKNPPQVIHLSGPGRSESVKRLYEGFQGRSLVMDSCYDMARLYPAADLVICRSGGSTVSELAVFGKCAILVPYPYAAEGHQDDNAAWLASAGGAKIIKDKDFTAQKLAAELNAWLADIPHATRLGEKAKEIAFPDASSKVLEMIDNIANLKHTV